MNKIILVRHGEPDLYIDRKISGHEISSFLEKYDKAPLKKSTYPPPSVQFWAKNATVVCSHLRRSIESAKRCEVDIDVSDKLFAEAIPPHFRSKNLVLKPKQWLVLSRILSLLGFSLHGESLRQSRLRAKEAAHYLVKLSKQQNVILFGHGLFNILIASELRKMGYEGPKVPARNFWDAGVYKLRYRSER